MTKKAFDKIAAGLQAAIDYAEGRADLEAFRMHVPPVDLAALRARLDLTQGEFAARFGFAVAEVQAWEENVRPEGAARAYLRVIERDPSAVMRALNDGTVTSANR